MAEKLKNVVREAYMELFNPFVSIMERIVAIWFLIAIFFGIPLMILGWITQEIGILEMAITNILLGCPYVILKARADKKR